MANSIGIIYCSNMSVSNAVLQKAIKFYLYLQKSMSNAFFLNIVFE